MIEFVIGKYGDSDYRLVKYDGTETEIGAGWSDRPDFEMCMTALMDHHGVGDSPFNSRSGAIDAHVLSNMWPLSTRDMTLDGEVLPWNDTTGE